MSKMLGVAAIVLLAITAVGAWAIFSVENERKNLELRQMEARRQAVLDSEGVAAWRHATKYETFWSELEGSPQEPKRSDTYTERNVWVPMVYRAGPDRIERRCALVVSILVGVFAVVIVAARRI